MTWKEYFQNPKRKLETILSFLFLITALISLANFLNYVETRNGIVLPDPLLNLFQPINLTWLTFGIIYFSLLLTIFLLAKKPESILLTIQTYVLIIAVRIVMMYVVPFNPPKNMLALNDPFVQFFGTGQILTKDLFFSGHTAIMFLFYLVAKSKKIKKILIVLTIIVAASVIIQHVHYTVDVLVAPFVTYGCYSAVKYFRTNLAFYK